MDTYSINPVVVRMKESEKGTIYQSIVALGMRARDINDQIRSEIHARLAEVIVDTDTEVMNYDQIAVSKEFDHLLKPTFFAMKEIMSGKLKIELTPTSPNPNTPGDQSSTAPVLPSIDETK